MLKIEFDANNLSLAAAIGAALSQYGAGESRQIGKKAELAAPYETETTLGTQLSEDRPKVFDLSEKDGKATLTVADAHTGETLAEEALSTEAAFAGKTEETAPADDAMIDEHGTPHNPQYCVSVKSQKPFYASGANKGQWKKKPGVDENAYNEWYAATMPLDEDEPKESAPVNTAAAFGAKTEETAPAASGDAPKDAGELMEYISERQAAGTLDQKLVTAAYGAVGVQINDLFGAGEAEAVAKLYAHLKTVSL